MRKLSVIFAVIATLAALAPSAAAIPGSGTIRVVSALADRSIDMYVDASLAVDDVGAFSVSDPTVVTAGTLDFDFRTAGADPLTLPVASVTADVGSGEDVLVIAHELDGGAFAISVIKALPVTLELSESFTHVIHAAQAPALDVTELNFGFITPAEGFTLASGEGLGTQFTAAGTNSFEFVDPTGPASVFGPADVVMEAGAYNAVILAGSENDTTLTVMSFVIGGLWDTNVYTAELSGDSEVPAVTSNDRGRVALIDTGDELWYTLTMQPGQTEEVTAAHIHAGVPGTNGSVLATLFSGGPDGDGGRLVQGLIADADLAPVPGAGFDGNYSTLVRMLKAGETYVNVHTVAHPAGEVRGDIYPLTIPMEPALFDDIVGNTHESNISIIAEAGIALGRADGSFGPNDAVTRGQLASFIGRALALDEVPGTTFPDTAGSVHEGYINAAAALGIVNGRADGTFGPNNPVTRGQAAAMVARALALVGDVVPGPAPFTDIAGNTFEAEITVLYWIEAVNGCTATSFCPADTLSRGQMASILSRALGWEVLLGLV
ncbi:MAG: S-layer homology domain-containing protein [Acidimicrobiia bacterium]|nr:S-layer homology domain-containing protein [Acidimicrobiia bacterium]